MSSSKYLTRTLLFKSQNFRQLSSRLLVFGLLIICSFIFLAPFFWMISLSLKTNIEVLKPNWIPKEILWINYPKAFMAMDFGLYLRNTLLVTTLSVVGSLISSSLAGFGFARTRFPGREILFSLVLATMLIPYTVTMIPQFIIFRFLGWLDTYFPIIVPIYFGGIPFFIFLMRQFFLQIPTELDSAARIDGCNFFGIYWRICLPLAKPALFTVAILGFVWEWNNLLGPLIYINTTAKRTIALALLFFRSEYTSHTGVNMIMALSVMFIIPPLLVFFIGQRSFVEGASFSGLKG